MNVSRTRPDFLKSSRALLAGGLLATGSSHAYSQERTESGAKPRFQISLAQWSLHTALRAGELDNLDLPRIAKETCGLDAVEWSNHFLYVENRKLGINIIVENHGGLSSNGTWLASVMKGVKFDDCGTLPDFGNFYVAKKPRRRWSLCKRKIVLR